MGIDLAIIAAYLIGINIVGFLSSRASNLTDYFLGGRRIPWPVACLSIVATETSSLTFLSLPGLAYATNLGFLQVSFGYLAGRALVAYILLPRYMEGRMETAYAFLQRRFSASSRRFIAVVFHVTRLLADGIRLFATAVPLSFLLGWDGYWQSILIIGAGTFAYTLYGGMRSVAVTDAIQMALYLFCAVAGLWLVADLTGLSFGELVAQVPAAKWAVFSTGFEGGWRNIFQGYNIFSGIVGGAMLSFASHGTDHLIVQRALACRDLASARRAMIGSGVMVLVQFAVFMFLGAALYVLMEGKPFTMPDAVVPRFIVDYVPHGLKGLMLAGIFAAAMSTISASINSISSSTVFDILILDGRSMTERQKVAVSRLVSLAWTAVMMAVALSLGSPESPLVELGLGIASITYGGMLGIFVFAAACPSVGERASVAGAAVSLFATAAIARFTPLFWPWYVPLGFLITLATGTAFSRIMLLMRNKNAGA